MNDYALVLNAGSSSLKFCVYQRPANDAWRLEARGQIEGIGTTPRLTAKNGAGAVMDDRQHEQTVCDGRTALATMGEWLRRARASASKASKTNPVAMLSRVSSWVSATVSFTAARGLPAPR